MVFFFLVPSNAADPSQSVSQSIKSTPAAVYLFLQNYYHKIKKCLHFNQAVFYRPCHGSFIDDCSDCEETFISHVFT